MKNWFGEESHPSDGLLHWSDQNRFNHEWGLGNKTFNTFDAYVASLRSDWELVTATPELKAAFERLLDAQHHIDSMEEGESYAGEDL
jgi:hypothetical protein